MEIQQRRVMKMVIKIWRETFKVLRIYPKIIIPFIISGICSGLALYLLFLAPQRPVAYVLAPPVRAFFGEKFLHYPFSLHLLPKLFWYAQVFLSGSIGVLMTGAAIGMLRDIYNGKVPGIFSNLIVSLKRYFALLGIWLIIFVVSFSFGKAVKVISPDNNITGLFFYLTYLVTILTQIIFVYAMPAVIIEKRNIFSSIKKNFSFLRRCFFSTFLLVITPGFLYLPVMIAKQNFPRLIKQLCPEVIVVVLGAGIFVSVIMDIFITISPTIVFLEKENI